MPIRPLAEDQVGIAHNFRRVAFPAQLLQRNGEVRSLSNGGFLRGIFHSEVQSFLEGFFWIEDLHFKGLVIGGKLKLVIWQPAFGGNEDFRHVEHKGNCVGRQNWHYRSIGGLGSQALPSPGTLPKEPAGVDAMNVEDFSYEEAVRSVLGELTVPIIYDADIGHRPPQLNLINGALAEVTCRNGQGIVTQRLV